MGTYATTTSILSCMIGLTGDTATTALISKRIDQAETEVNKFLSKRYDMTSAYFQTATSVPPVVRQLTERLAEAFSWQSVARGDKEALKLAESIIGEVPAVRSAGSGVMLNLYQIANYQADLLNTAGSVIPDMSNTSFRVKCNTTNYPTTFNEDEPTEWRPSSTKLEDIADERED